MECVCFASALFLLVQYGQENEMKKLVVALIFMLIFTFALSACALIGGGEDGGNHVCTAGRTYTEITVEPSCSNEGLKGIYTYCSECDKLMESNYEAIEKEEHTPDTPLKDYITYPTCAEDGVYTETVQCKDCNYIISQSEKTEPKNDDHNTDFKEENYIEATCVRGGSYDGVLYCTRCGEEFSRTTITLDKTEHTPGTAVTENVISAGCGNPGTYDLVVYCSNSECHQELSREKKTTDKIPHSPADAKVENKINASCTSNGSYDSVIYCSKCDTEISRSTIIIPITHQNDEYGICVICDPDASRGLEITGSTVTGIGNCTDTNIVIPLLHNGTKVTGIDISAFSGCDFIKSLTISENVTHIGDGAFLNCSGLKTVKFEEESLLISIYSNAFSGCTSLENIAFPGKLATIGNAAFKGCVSLKSIVISDSIYQISKEAFADCTSLENLIIGNGVQTIGESAFYNCKFLKVLVLPDGVMTIGNYAFRNCSSLISVTLPSSLNSIADNYNAFTSCEKIVEVVNNSSLPIKVGEYTYGLVSRYAIEVHSGESKIVDQDGYLFYTYNGVNYLIGYNGYDTDLILPEDYNNEKYVIYKRAFRDVQSIESINIPGSVSEICEYAFSGCSNLKSAVISDGVAKIQTGAFYGCGLEALILKSTERLDISGDDVFKNCTDLKKVVLSANVYISGNDVFYGCPIEIAEVSNGCLSKLPKKLISSLTVNGYGYIPAQSFKDCISLVTLSIGDNITGVLDKAFYGCANLVSVTLGESVTSIGDEAFYNCYKLIEIINKSSLYIQKQGYDYGEIARYSMDIHSGNSKVVEKDDYLYYTYDDVNYLLAYLGSDTDVVLPLNYNGEGYEIYYAAFYGNTDILSVNIPLGLGKINAWAFKDCTNLTSVNMGYTIEYIGADVFTGCGNLERVYFSGTEEQWSNIEWYDSEPIAATVYYFSASMPTSSGNYWHYDENGNITVW